MRTVEEIVSIPSYDPLRHMHFGSDELPNAVIYMGKQGDINVEHNGSLNLFLDFEQPNMWMHEDSYNNCILNEQRYNYILSLCPYTSKWRNEDIGMRKYITIPHFINKRYLVEKEKQYDVIYTGNVKNYHIWIIDSVKKFNHRILSGQGFSYQVKLQMIAQSRISLVHNLLYLDNDQMNFIEGIKDYQSNPIFSSARQLGICPQLKTRLFEAAACKSLILCKRDPWNVIERYFSPDEFVYFDEPELEDVMKTILNNYDSYKPIVEKAYNRFINNYTTDKIINYIPR